MIGLLLAALLTVVPPLIVEVIHDSDKDLRAVAVPAGVRVEVRDSFSGELMAEGETDANGKASFDLPMGHYTLTAAIPPPPGYNTWACMKHIFLQPQVAPVRFTYLVCDGSAKLWLPHLSLAE